MGMKQQICISILIGLLFSSCHPVYRAEIKNETDQNILIEVGFDKQELEKSWDGRPYMSFLWSYPTGYLGENAILFDSINLTKTFRIPPGLSFPLETGIGSRPRYELFRSVRIMQRDTLTFPDKKAISKAFQNI